MAFTFEYYMADPVFLPSPDHLILFLVPIVVPLYLFSCLSSRSFPSSSTPTSQKPPVSGYLLSCMSRFQLHREPHVHTALMILYFMSLFKLLLNNFLRLKAFLAIPILVLISVSLLPSLMMRAP